jgi:hypothetical protein
MLQIDMFLLETGYKEARQNALCSHSKVGPISASSGRECDDPFSWFQTTYQESEIDI